MGLATAIALGSLAVSGASAYSSAKYQKASIQNQNEAADAQKKQVALTNMRQKRDAVRQARQMQASAANSASNQNVSDSSASLGGIGSIQSQLGSNLSFLDQYNKYSSQASDALGQARINEGKAQMFGDLASVSMSVFSNSATIADKVKTGYNKVFGT